MIAAHELLAPFDVGEEATDLVHGAIAVVAARAGRWPGPDTVERLHQRVDRRVAVECLPAPWRREVAPLHQLPAGAAKTCPRPLVGPSPPYLLAERSPHTGARVGELGLEPALEHPPEQPAGNVVGRHVKLRVDPGLHRPLAKQLGTERVDGADP